MEGKARLAFLAVVTASLLLLLIAAAAALGSLGFQRASRIVPVVQAPGSGLGLVAAHKPSGGTRHKAHAAPAKPKSNGSKEEHEVDSDPKVDLDEMKAKLTPEQYSVCFNAATEPPFTGAYWDNHEPGMYHCVACGEPLFSSGTKFDSGTGWPSFYDAVEQGNVETRTDRSHGMVRTEVLCGHCGAHLGHLFDDGPKPTGLRYCINSAALDFRADEK